MMLVKNKLVLFSSCDFVLQTCSSLRRRGIFSCSSGAILLMLLTSVKLVHLAFKMLYTYL